MGLFSFMRNKERIIPGQRLDRLDSNGELPYGWYYANREFTSRIESEYKYFSSEYCNAKGKGVLVEYAALKSLVLYMEDVKRLCDSMGECFAKWASFSVADPVSMNELKNRLTQMEANMNELLKKEKETTQMKTALMNIIKTEPGILQSDLYKRFRPDLKSQISNEIYLLASSGTIIREKSGRSYKLYEK